MDIDCLETFLAVTRLGSFTGAASVRHLTQPAVSRQIRRLEDDLGVKLFVQTGRCVKPTVEGELLVEHGLRILAQIEGARAALEDIGELRRGELRVGASSTPGMYLIPGLLAEFRGRYPGVTLRYEMANSRAIENLIVHNELELGFVGERIATQLAVAEAFATDRIRIVVAPTHPLARRRAVSLEEVLASAYVAREEGSATRRVFEQWLAEQGAQWRPLLVLPSVEAVKQTVAAGLGAGVLSSLAVDWELRAKRLAVVRVKGMTLTRELFVVRRKKVRLSAAAGAFLAMLPGFAERPTRRS